MSKDFYIKFVPADWLSGQDLRRCSPAARGVWLDMLCLMFQCDEPGCLATAGVPWTVDDVCTALGGEGSLTRSCIAELLSKGVARTDSRGAFISRRMIREAQIRKMRKKAGKKGGKSLQILLRQNSSKRQANTQANLKQKSNSDSNSNSESGSLSSEREPKHQNPAREKSKPPEIPPVLDTPEFREVWADWLAMRREKRKPATPTSQKRQLAELAGMGLERAIEATRYSVAKGWDGIYEPKESLYGQANGSRRWGAQGRAAGDRGVAEGEGDPRRRHEHGAAPSRLEAGAIRIGVARTQGGVRAEGAREDAATGVAGGLPAQPGGGPRLPGAGEGTHAGRPDESAA